MPWGGLLTAGIMAAAGVVKSQAVDKPKEERQRKLAAETARYSPWTDMAPNQVQEADPFGSALQFGATGYGMGQSYNRAASDEEFRKALLAGNSSSGGSGSSMDFGSYTPVRNRDTGYTR